MKFEWEVVGYNYPPTTYKLQFDNLFTLTTYQSSKNSWLLFVDNKKKPLGEFAWWLDMENFVVSYVEDQLKLIIGILVEKVNIKSIENIITPKSNPIIFNQNEKILHFQVCCGEVLEESIFCTLDVDHIGDHFSSDIQRFF